MEAGDALSWQAVIPAAANNPGRFGSHFKTRVVIFNPTSSDYAITARLYGTNGFISRKAIAIDSGEYVVWDNFLGQVFDYAGPGAVWLRASGEDDQFYMTAEVYTDSPNGRYSTTVVSGIIPTVVNGIEPDFNVGISVNQNRRTNIGVWNRDTRPSSVEAKVFDAYGTLLETIGFELKGEARQQETVSVPVDNGLVRWEINGESRTHYFYAVEVDNGSNDGTLAWSMNGSKVSGGGGSEDGGGGSEDGGGGSEDGGGGSEDGGGGSGGGGIEHGRPGGTTLFSEDFESYAVGSLTEDYVIVFNGLGDAEQRVEVEAGNGHLRTAGRLGWGLAVRKDFDFDLPQVAIVSWRMRVDNDIDFDGYTDPSGARYVHFGSFGLKTTDEVEANLSINKYVSDGKIVAYCPAGCGSRPEVQLGVWTEFRMDIDFASGRYSLYKDGEKFCELATGLADLSSQWNSWGEPSGIRFGSGNQGNSVTRFDDIVIRGEIRKGPGAE